MGEYRRTWERLCRDRRAAAALGILAVELLCVVFLPAVLDLDPYLTDRMAGFWAAPSWEHWLGTDDVGRDILARLLYGGRTSLLVGFSSAAISVVLGILLGILAGYRRGIWEFWIMRLADIFQSFPSIVLVLCLVSLVGPSVLNIVLVTGGLGWPSVTRMVYANTLTIREKEYILAVRALGARHSTILLRNILPNAVAPAWASMAQRVGRAILSESSLSFLGVGLSPPQASWGNLMYSASQLSVLTGKPWVWVPPGLLIVITVICCQMVGEGLRDAMDPRCRRYTAS